MEVVVLVKFLLPAGLVEVLAEIALLVEKSDAHDRHAEVARGLQVVAGQDAQAAGEDGEAFGQAELGGKVRGQAAVDRLVRALIPAGFAGDVFVELPGDPVQVGHERVVSRRGFQALLVDGTQHADRIVAARLPEVAVEPPKQLDGVVVPAPVQVVGDSPQGLECGRQRWHDGERMNRLHGEPVIWCSW